MIEARLSAHLPSQHGVGEELLDEHFDATIQELPRGHVAVVALLQPKDAGTVQTADGPKRWVKYEIVRLEVPAGADSHRARDLILSGHAHRVGGDVLPLDFTTRQEDDQKALLLERAFDWAERREVDLNESWWGRYDQQHVPAPRNASYQQLRDFCIDEGILEPDEDRASDADSAGVPAAAFSDTGEPSLDGDDDTAGGEE